jgi:hypothetical protein
MNYPPRAHGRHGGQPGKPTHDFRKYLEAENLEANAAWWSMIYARVFPGIVHTFVCPRGSDDQKSGVDRILWTANDERITVQEKMRGQVRDFLFEDRIERADGTRIGGWVEHTKAQFLVYGSRADGLFRIWQTEPLLRKWRTFRGIWIARYGELRAVNRGYVAVNVPVPLSCLPEPIKVVSIPPVLLRIPNNSHYR